MKKKAVGLVPLLLAPVMASGQPTTAAAVLQDVRSNVIVACPEPSPPGTVVRLITSDGTVEHDKTVFEFAEEMRKYQYCVATNLAATRMLYASNPDPNIAAISTLAFQSLEQTLLVDAADKSAAAQATANFMDLSWGLGFGYSFGRDDFLEEAQVVDGVIRVTKDKTDKARVLFETHRFLWCNKKETLKDRGCGPFGAVAATDSKLLSGVGVGFMYGRKSRDPKETEGFSVGIGFILDNDVKTLADGFEEGAALPAGESGIRYEEKSRWSTLLFITRTF